MGASRRGRGEGGVERLPSGSYRAVVCRTAADGTRLRQSKTFKQKADALAWIRSLAEAGPSPAGTVGEWLDDWLRGHGRRVEAKTFATDRWTVDSYLRPAFGRDKLRDLTPRRVEDGIGGLACSDNEKHKAARTLRNALNAAVRAGLLPASPMGGKKVAMPRRRVAEARSLTPAELAALVSHADGCGCGWWVRAWVDAAMRPAEVLGLRWGDFDPAAGTLRIERAVCGVTGRLKGPKTAKSRRTLPLAPSTAAALLAARPAGFDPAAPVLPDSRGGHWWPQNFASKVFRPLVAAAGVTCAPYTLRHTAATLLLRAGVGLKVVSERLGHEDVALTLRTYAHVLPGDQLAAAGAVETLLPTFSPRPSSNP